MSDLYLLEHYYEDENGEDVYKVLGIFSTKERAENEKNLYAQKKGFKQYPPDCFIISRCIENKGDWSTGFISLQS